MKKGIVPGDDDYCYICKYLAKVNPPMLATDRHHMLYGTGKRPLSDSDGLTINICRYHHDRLHTFGAYKEETQQLAQRVWEQHYKKPTEEFIKRYGKSYL